MKVHIAPALAALATVLLAGCSDDGTPAVPPPGPEASSASRQGQAPRPMPGEEYLFRIESRVPGFGGMYYDDDGDLVVFLADLRLADAARAAVLPHLSGPGKRGVSEGPPAAVKFRQGRFSFIELNDYWQKINQGVFDIPGVLSTDVDETQNRVLVRARGDAARQAVLAAAAELAIPQGAVQVQTIEPCYNIEPNCGEPGGGGTEPGTGEELPPAPELAEGDTTSIADGAVAPDSPPNSNPELYEYYFTGPALLTDWRRDLAGGLMISYRAPNSTKQSYCTLGFNVRYGNGMFVTASHCSPRMGSTAGATGTYATDAYYFQPKVGTGGGNNIGWEYLDPRFQPASYWRARNVNTCPDSQFVGCRWSDALLVAYRSDISAYRSVRYGRIERAAENWREIKSPPYQVRQKSSIRALAGAALFFVGSQSGVVRGTVRAACQQGPSYTSNNLRNQLMCQEVVSFTGSASGDSGAAVLVGSPAATDVTLYGVYSGGTGTYGHYVSHVSNIESDLGVYLYVN